MKHVIGFLIFVTFLPACSQVEIRGIATDGNGKTAPALKDHLDSVFADSYDVRIMEHPNRAYRAGIFANSLENEKDIQKARYYYYLLKRVYGDIDYIKGVLMEFNPDGAIAVGKPIPPFEVTLLDGSGKVTDKSMLGKYYLIDFWATWCAGCVAEIPYLHNACEKYQGVKGFEILSLSMDKTEAQIRSFLAAKWEKKWQMPWLNAFIPEGFESKLAKEFEVVGVDRPIFVGPDGRILAIRDLHGDELEEMLEQYLGGSD
jgi:thiol-disulfide isomerase/thioredoxin